MKRPLLSGIAALSVVVCPSARALDFQTHFAQVQEDGFTREQIYITGDARTHINLTLPGDWTPTATADAFTLAPPDKLAGSAIRLEKSPFRPEQAFDEKGLAAYQRSAFVQAPSGAVDVRFAEQRPDPLPVMNWKSHEFVVTYNFFGQLFCKSILFLNLESKEQIICTVTAPKSSSDTAHSVAFGVLRSWQPEPVKDR